MHVLKRGLVWLVLVGLATALGYLAGSFGLI